MTVWATRADQVDLRGPNPHDLARSPERALLRHRDAGCGGGHPRDRAQRAEGDRRRRRHHGARSRPERHHELPRQHRFLYYFLALLVVAMLAVYAIARSRFGFALRAINQDEDAAAAAGINTTRMKIAAFMVSGAITAAAGSIYAFQQVSIYPDRLFSVDITVLMVIMAVIGGSGTVIGPLVGGVGLQFLSEYLRQNFTDYHTFIFGAIIIVAVVLLPEGAV